MGGLRWVPQVFEDPMAAADSIRRATPHPAPADTAPRARDAPLGPSGLPEIHIDDVEGTTIDTAIFDWGALIVRGLLTGEVLERFRRRSHRAARHRDRYRSDADAADDPRADGAPSRHFSPLTTPLLDPGYVAGMRAVNNFCFAVGALEAPRLGGPFLAAVAGSGILRAITDHLGEPPTLTFERWAFRSVPAEIGTGDIEVDVYPAWHQDGALWDPRTRAVDLWVTFDHCGGTSAARGIELVPTRLTHNLRTDLTGPNWVFDRSRLGPLLEAHPPVSPEFAPGDAVMFDRFTLHRTAGGDRYTQRRASAELWWFAPSAFPDGFRPVGVVPAPT